MAGQNVRFYEGNGNTMRPNNFPGQNLAALKEYIDRRLKKESAKCLKKAEERTDEKLDSLLQAISEQGTQLDKLFKYNKETDQKSKALGCACHFILDKLAESGGDNNKNDDPTTIQEMKKQLNLVGLKGKYPPYGEIMFLSLLIAILMARAYHYFKFELFAGSYQEAE